jgi:hypothetical protein
MAWNEFPHRYQGERVGATTSYPLSESVDAGMTDNPLTRCEIPVLLLRW